MLINSTKHETIVVKLFHYFGGKLMGSALLLVFRSDIRTFTSSAIVDVIKKAYLDSSRSSRNAFWCIGPFFVDLC